MKLIIVLMISLSAFHASAAPAASGCAPLLIGSFRELVKLGLENKSLSAAQLRSVLESPRPINPMNRSGLTSEQLKLKQAFDKFLSRISAADWSSVQKDLMIIFDQFKNDKDQKDQSARETRSVVNPKLIGQIPIDIYERNFKFETPDSPTLVIDKGADLSDLKDGKVGPVHVRVKMFEAAKYVLPKDLEKAAYSGWHCIPNPEQGMDCVFRYRTNNPLRENVRYIHISEPGDRRLERIINYTPNTNGVQGETFRLVRLLDGRLLVAIADPKSVTVVDVHTNQRIAFHEGFNFPKPEWIGEDADELFLVVHQTGRESVLIEALAPLGPRVAFDGIHGWVSPTAPVWIRAEDGQIYFSFQSYRNDSNVGARPGSIKQKQVKFPINLHIFQLFSDPSAS